MSSPGHLVPRAGGAEWITLSTAAAVRPRPLVLAKVTTHQGRWVVAGSRLWGTAVNAGHACKGGKQQISSLHCGKQGTESCLHYRERRSESIYVTKNMGPRQLYITGNTSPNPVYKLVNTSLSPVSMTKNMYLSPVYIKGHTDLTWVYITSNTILSSGNTYLSESTLQYKEHRSECSLCNREHEPGLQYWEQGSENTGLSPVYSSQ